jgi:predicted O-methyltransferase YrrM
MPGGLRGGSGGPSAEAGTGALTSGDRGPGGAAAGGAAAGARVPNAVRRRLSRLAPHVPVLGRLVVERRELRARNLELEGQVESLRALNTDFAQRLGVGCRAVQFVPAGHFYSPIVSLNELDRDRDRVFGQPPRELPGLDLREDAQMALLEGFLPSYRTLSFPKQRTAGSRYFLANPAYAWTDGVFLHCMLRHLRPRRVVEVGSGYSSCAILDTNEQFLDGSMACTFVEPFPEETLYTLLGQEDRERLDIREQRLQDVEPGLFTSLAENDVLFIDSSHVVKAGSDVQFLFEEILPRLRHGVYVHFHDIFYPFEYPAEWVDEGRNWTEDYVLRAFLTFNDAYEMVLFGSFIDQFHGDWLGRNMPLCTNHKSGNLWIRRRA